MVPHPISNKNPDGITIVDGHIRRLKGTYLDPDEIDDVFKNHGRKNLIWPTVGQLDHLKNADKYDELIAVWTDYFNKKFGINPPLDPDVVKTLIASESDFRLDPPRNRTAFGIAQITKETWKILQDTNGEAKDFIFSKIRQRDLKDPEIAISMAVRCLFRVLCSRIGPGKHGDDFFPNKRGGKHIYIAGLGDIKDTDVNKNLEYVFPRKGKIRGNGRSLSFVAISNENGLCFDAYGGFEEQPCPSEPFPLWNKVRASPR